MEKQVMIRCKSIQRDERGKAEEVVLETPGVYGEDEDCRYLTYEETSLSGMEGTTTTIRMYGDHVTLSRQGSFLQETEYKVGVYNAGRTCGNHCFFERNHRYGERGKGAAPPDL